MVVGTVAGSWEAAALAVVAPAVEGLAVVATVGGATAVVEPEEGARRMEQHCFGRQRRNCVHCRRLRPKAGPGSNPCS